MKNWTYQDQMELEESVRDSYYDEDHYRKLGSKLYILDSQYQDFEEVNDYEFCSTVFQTF